MQKIVLVVVCALLAISTIALTANDKILGQWTDEDQSRVLEFVRTGPYYEAIIREADNPSYVGKKQITFLKNYSANEFKGGTLHVLKKGKTVHCSITLLSDTKLELKVTHGRMSKSVVWTKVTTK